MNKEEINSQQDFEAYVAEKEKGFCDLIDTWIKDGPTYKRERLTELADRLKKSEAINQPEYDLLMECITFVPKAGDGALNLSFALAPAAEDAEYKGYVAKVMAMMSFLGRVE